VLEAVKETATVTPVIVTSFWLKPMEEKTNMPVASLTGIRKLPFASVVVPFLEPLGTTVTPCTGLPSFESVTFPEMILFCVNAGMHSSKRRERTPVLASNRFFLIN
jgi:hypothetical protein